MPDLLWHAAGAQWLNTARSRDTGWCAEPCLQALRDHASRRVPAPNFIFVGQRAVKGLPALPCMSEVAMLQPLPALNFQVLACRAQLRLGAKRYSPMRRRGLPQSRHSPSREANVARPVASNRATGASLYTKQVGGTSFTDALDPHICTSLACWTGAMTGIKASCPPVELPMPAQA